jgi:hypothetical protein
MGKNAAFQPRLKEYFSLSGIKNTKPFQQDLPRSHYL